MDKFLQTQNIAKLNQEGRENVNRFIIIKQQLKKSHDKESRTWYLYWVNLPLFKGKLIPILLQFSSNLKRKEHYYPLWDQGTLTQSQTQKHWRENYRPISLMNNGAKILSKILAKSIQQHVKGLYTMTSGIYSENSRIVQYTKINLCNTSLTEWRGEGKKKQLTSCWMVKEWKLSSKIQK